MGTLVTSTGCRPLFGLLDPTETHPDLVAQRPVVESVRTLRRVGPDGQVRFDLVAEVTQDVSVWTGEGTVRLCGGSTIFIGPDGGVRLVVRKGLTNAERRLRQVAFVKSSGELEDGAH